MNMAQLKSQTSQHYPTRPTPSPVSHLRTQDPLALGGPHIQRQMLQPELARFVQKQHRPGGNRWNRGDPAGGWGSKDHIPGTMAKIDFCRGDRVWEGVPPGTIFY